MCMFTSEQHYTSNLSDHMASVCHLLYHSYIGHVVRKLSTFFANTEVVAVSDVLMTILHILLC